MSTAWIKKKSWLLEVYSNLQDLSLPFVKHVLMFGFHLTTQLSFTLSVAIHKKKVLEISAIGLLVK